MVPLIVAQCVLNIFFLFNYDISPHCKFLLSNPILDFCELFLNKMTSNKGLTMQITFFTIFTKGADIFGHDCL